MRRGLFYGGLFLLALPLIAWTEEVPETVVFAGSSGYPPFQWLDDEGQPRGFLIELQDAMAVQGGRAARHALMDWEKALAAVRQGEADVVALFASEPRDRDYDFTEAFYHVAHGIFSHAEGESFGRLEDLAGRTVAVVAGAYAEQRLAQRPDGMRLLPAPNELGCLVLVAERQAVACVEATHTVRRLAAEANLPVRQSSPPFWPRPYVFGVREGNQALLDWLNTQLAMVQITGQYQTLYNQWLPELEWQRPTLADKLRNLAWILIPLLCIAIVGYLWSWALRRQVAKKTRRLATELQRRKWLQDELQYRVGHDMLTDLPNRTAFVDELEGMIDRDSAWLPSVILIRFVNLEQLINAFSYSVGHELLKVFARRLRGQGFRLVSHFGSGVFAVAPQQPMDGGEVLAMITDPVALGSIDLDPQILVGTVRDTPRNGGVELAEELIRRARTALAAAQEKGRRWMEYSVGLEPDPTDLLLLQDFHRYGTRDMFLQYQPKVDLRSGRIQAAEALIRWQHPSLGLISPGRFIPLLEQSGLIHQITCWVITEAAAMAMRLQSETGDCCISVNMAAQDLLETDLLSLITRVRGGLQTRNLRLEITETGFIEDPARAKDVLAALREAGIYCAVDDFGTGYSSLSYLSEFPVDEVKIDRQFVGDMLDNPRHRVIVRSTITLAHELGLTITAEGAEDLATIEALAELGCDAVQGFAISRPVSETELAAMIGRSMHSVMAEHDANPN